MLKKDLQFLKQQFQAIDETPEVHNLKKLQIRLIKISLYLSLRYNRYRRNNWQKTTNINPNDPYAQTATFFGWWFCHASARAIQQSQFNEKLLLSTPPEYFEASFTSRQIHNQTQLKPYISQQKAPKIVHLASKTDGKITPMHTVIYLGNHPRLGGLVFEKEAAFELFKMTSIATLIEYYPGFYWGFKNFDDSTT